MLSNAQQTFGGPSYPFPTDGTSSTPWPDVSTLYPSPGYDVSHAQMKGFSGAPCDASASHEGLYYQLDLGPELPDNYLDFSGAYSDAPPNDNPHTVSSGFYAPLVSHPPISSVASTDVYDTSLWVSLSQQDVAGYNYGSDDFTRHDTQNRSDTSAQLYSNPPAASFAYPPQAGGVVYSHTEPSPQRQLSPNHPAPNAHHLPRRSPRTTSTSPYPSPSDPERQQFGELTTYKRRNVQVSPTAAAVASSSTRPPQANKWQCPFCPHIQHNRRSPDFKRHLETHTPPEESPRWVCCGVPYSQARALGVPEEVIREEAFEFSGTCMVGGCKKTFSRRDALSRHLRKTVGECYGDAFASYQPGNRDGMMM